MHSTGGSERSAAEVANKLAGAAPTDSPNADKPDDGARQFEVLRLDGVTRAFGATDALRDFNITIRGGEFVAFLGPSGSGKSTALNCLAGLLPLTAGEIWLDDRRIDTLPPERRGFAMVFQNYALFPHLDVRRNVGFGLRMRKVPKQEMKRRVDEALTLVRLAHKADSHPAQLSGGEQQRVAIARAVVCEPPLVLMDEPLSNLDAKLRLEMRTEIRRLHQDLGLTTVYVTHDQHEALSLADRIVILRNGVVEQEGTPSEVYIEPQTDFVAGFLGYRNALTGNVVESHGRQTTVAVGDLRLVGTCPEVMPVGDAVVRIRPDDLMVCDGDDAGPNRIPLLVKVVEYGGREFVVEGVTPAGQRLYFMASQAPRLGDSVIVAVDPENVRVFSPTEDGG